MCGIKAIAVGLVDQIKTIRPFQRKAQRKDLVLLAARTLDVRRTTLMDLVASLPREADRMDRRYRWISRVLIDPDVIMRAFSRAVIEHAARGGQPIVLVMERSKVFSHSKASNSWPRSRQPPSASSTIRGHDEAWIIAMSAGPAPLETLIYSCRCGIEPMFSKLKSRGFAIAQTQIQHADRLGRLILVMALALYYAVSTGLWDAEHNPIPLEKKSEATAPKTRPIQTFLVHQEIAAAHETHASRTSLTASG